MGLEVYQHIQTLLLCSNVQPNIDSATMPKLLERGEYLQERIHIVHITIN